MLGLLDHGFDRVLLQVWRIARHLELAAHQRSQLRAHRFFLGPVDAHAVSDDRCQLARDPRQHHIAEDLHGAVVGGAFVI